VRIYKFDWRDFLFPDSFDHYDGGKKRYVVH
jgi:hypothetical protein